MIRGGFIAGHTMVKQNIPPALSELGDDKRINLFGAIHPRQNYRLDQFGHMIKLYSVVDQAHVHRQDSHQSHVRLNKYVVVWRISQVYTTAPLWF